MDVRRRAAKASYRPRMLKGSTLLSPITAARLGRHVGRGSTVAFQPSPPWTVPPPRRLRDSLSRKLRTSPVQLGFPKPGVLSAMSPPNGARDEPLVWPDAHYPPYRPPRLAPSGLASEPSVWTTRPSVINKSRGSSVSSFETEDADRCVPGPGYSRRRHFPPPMPSPRCRACSKSSLRFAPHLAGGY